MPGVPPNIPLAGWDVERRRLETTLDGDLSTLSLSSVPTVNSHISGGSVGASFISASSIERPRSAMVQPPSAWPSGMDDSFIAAGPSGTPRAAARRASGYDAAGRRHVSGASGISMGSMTSLVDSPKSTEGHHVSAMTLGGRLFRRNGVDMDDGSDFDPERSLGRLVGELGRVMSGNLAPRPASPFTHVLSPPRSPSPLPSHASKENGLNLSLTLTRADPLPSPPDSQGSNHSAPADETAHHAQSSAGFTSMARQLKEDLRSQPSQRSVPAPRRALSDSTTFNIAQAVPVRSEKTSKNRSTRDAHLRPPRAEQSAPAGSRRRADITSDITGMTGLMGTPAKGGAFLSIGRDGDVGGDAAGNIPQTLATLHARLRGLETEGSLARRRVRELEGELDRARGEVDEARRDGGARLQEVSGEKSALEELVNSLRSNLARLTAELESNKQLVLDLQSAQEALRTQPPTPPRPGAANELTALRREIERLSGEIRRLGGIVEQGLETRRKTREERTVRIDETILPDPAPNGPSAPAAMRSGGGESPSLIELDEEISAPQPTEPVAPSRLRQGLHASAVTTPTLMPPTVQPATRISRPNVPHKPSPLAQADDSPTTRPSTRMEKDPGRRASGGSSSEDGSGSNRSNRSDRSGRRSRAAPDGPSSPFPSIRAEDEADFFAQMEEPTPVRAKSTRCLPEAGKGSKDQQSARGARGAHHGSARPERQRERDGVPMDAFGAAALPPQTVLARVIAELEDDYAHYRSIYGELAEQYKLLDASGATNKRAILAQHLKEVIDTLEQKAGQIQALYSLLHFQDRPIDARSSHAAASAGVQVKGAPADVFRMVRETLGEEAVRRLEEDGVTMGRRRGARLV